jgi:hypothetical protein
MIWTPRQSIGSILDPRFVNDGELEPGQKEGPTGLSAGKFLLRRKVNKVVVVRPHLGGVASSLKVVSEGMESMDNCEKLLVADFIVALGRLE